jgi:hypothetical protein
MTSWAHGSIAKTVNPEVALLQFDDLIIVSARRFRPSCRLTWYQGNVKLAEPFKQSPIASEMLVKCAPHGSASISGCDIEQRDDRLLGRGSLEMAVSVK